MPSIRVIGAFALLMVVSAFAAQTNSGGSTQQARAFTLNLAAQLADPPGLSRTCQAERETLRETVEAATEPLDRAAAHLAFANWLLSVPTAMPATRWLIGLEQPGDRPAIAAAAKEARGHIDQARPLLKKSAGTARKRFAQLQNALDALEPFTELFSAMTSPDGTDQYRSATADAALSLAVVRETDDPLLASSALLWQSFGLDLAGRRERALTALPEALAPPEHLPYDFMCRLLRCRLLSDSGHEAAALSLSIRIRAACTTWFTRDRRDDAEAARRLAALIECRVGKAWIAKIPASQPANAARVEAILAKVQESTFNAELPEGVYRLKNAVPIVVTPPSLSRPASSTAPAPASSSSSSTPKPVTKPRKTPASSSSSPS